MPKKGVVALLLTVFSIFLIKECVSHYSLFSGNENEQPYLPGHSRAVDTARIQKIDPDTASSNPEIPKVSKPEPAVLRSENHVPARVKNTPPLQKPAPGPDTSTQLAQRQQAEKDLLKTAVKKDTTTKTMGIPGNAGDDPLGRPGTGSGIGFAPAAGLGNRKVVSRESPKDDSQAEGRVCINICVNALGDVTSAEATQRGSTTNDADLRSKSIKAVKNWKFEPRPGVETQCGTVTFDYRLK